MPYEPYPDRLPIHWASDPESLVVRPSDEKIAIGFYEKEKPRAGWLNQFFNLFSGWIRAIYHTDIIAFHDVAHAAAEAQPWQSVRVVEKATNARPGDQVTASPSSINLGQASQVEGAGFDGRYLYAIEGMKVKRWDLLNGTYSGTSYAPGWSTGSIEQVATNGRFLVMVGKDTVADTGKATVIDLVDGSTLTTVQLSSTAAALALHRTRVSLDYAWVARAQTEEDDHDVVRISLEDGTSTNLTLLVSGTAPTGFDVAEEALAIAAGDGHEVYIYDGAGEELFATASASDPSFNIRDLRMVDGKILAVMNTDATPPLMFAKFNTRGVLIDEVMLSNSKATFTMALDCECAYILLGDDTGSFSSVELLALNHEDPNALRFAWRRVNTYPSPSTDFAGIFSDGLHLWTDTTTSSNPQVRRLYTNRRSRIFHKIPPGEQGQKLGLLLTRTL